ncbi:MAG: hypothetical protein ABIV21_00805 [Pyrinomonadaceae bacterium]
MKTVDLSAYFVVYDFMIGVLIMLASEKLGQYAGYINKSHGAGIARLTRVSTFTFGATITFLMAYLYIAVFTLRIGV